MLCLGVESSCDETAMAIVRDGKPIGAVLASSAEVHALFGGVVPELASREHYRFIGLLYDELMRKTGLSINDIDAVCVTRGPGLLGALLVGVAFAKGLAAASSKPLIGVNHLHAHLMAAGIAQDISYPAIGLLVSGGHTHTYQINSPVDMVLLGRTLDDAAGEAFDKFAKMLGLPYPGGALLDRLGQRGVAEKDAFPRPYVHADSPDFSFSGLKTAASLWLREHPSVLENGREVRVRGESAASAELCDVCASYALAVAETLRLKTEYALDHIADGKSIHSLVVAGGVAANSQVRSQMKILAKARRLELVIPEFKLCTDNAVMIAHMGWQMARHGMRHGLDMAAIPRGQHIPEDYTVLPSLQA